MLNVDQSLRTKEPVFSKLFLKALLLAALLHGSAYFLFDIQTPLLPPYRPLRPIRMTAEISDPKQPRASAHVAMPTPAASAPRLPSTLALGETPEADGHPPIPTFDTHTYHPRHLGGLFETSYAPIAVRISGDLSTRPILINPTPVEKRVGKSITTRIASFRVQLDERTGSIFWVENEKSTGDPNLDAKAEHLIRSLKFARKANTYITDGIVEVKFSSEERQA